MTVPNQFANVTTSIPLSQLDANFNTPITLGNTAIQLGNTVSTLNNMTLANVTVSSGNVTITNVSVTTANVTTANIGTSIITTSETLNYGTANQVQYLNASKVLTGSANLTFDGTTLTPHTLTVSTGVLTVPAGSNTAPSITTSGDTNTGIFYPAADTVAIGTGGTERLRVDSAGNMGLGVTPSAWSTSNSIRAFQIGPSGVGSFWNYNNYAAFVGCGYYWNGTNRIYLTTGNPVSEYSQNSGIHSWLTAASGTAGNTITFTQAMTLDASGNLGLNVTPGTWTNNFKAFQYGSAGSLVHQSGTTAFWLGSNWIYNGGDKYINTDFATLYSQQAGVHKWWVAPSGTAGNAISFAQVMELNNSGSLVVTTRSLALVGNFISNVAGDVSQPAVFIQKYDNNSTTSQIFMRFVINNQGNACGQITANGANTAAFGTVSDQRLKDNIVDLPSQLDNILALRPVEFDYIESEGGGHQLGFIAQEVQEIYPDLVGEREDGMLTLTDMNKNDARLIKAFQELAAKVQALEAEVQALKGNA